MPLACSGSLERVFFEACAIKRLSGLRFSDSAIERFAIERMLDLVQGISFGLFLTWLG